jgi:hypothetical protein
MTSFATVHLPGQQTFGNVLAGYRQKGISFPQHLQNADAFRLEGDPVILELGLALVGELAPRPSRHGGALAFGAGPLEPGYVGVPLEEVYGGVRRRDGLLLTHQEALLLPLHLPPPAYQLEEDEKFSGRSKEGTWYRFAMEPTEMIAGSARILCFGSDAKGPNLNENPADGTLLWAPIESFLYVIRRMPQK